MGASDVRAILWEGYVDVCVRDLSSPSLEEMERWDFVQIPY